MSKIVRQGDILLVPVSEAPATAAPVEAENGRLILARGEVTGHHHSIAMSERVALFREDGSGGGLFLFASGPVSLEHQEHTALAVEPGAYEVRQQIQWSDADEPIAVRD
jgi:hypothetical protein